MEYEVKTSRDDSNSDAAWLMADDEEHAANIYGLAQSFPPYCYVGTTRFNLVRDADGNKTYRKDLSEFVFRYKRKDYLVQIGNQQVSVWRLADDGGVIPGVRGFNGKMSKRALQYLIDRVRWDEFPELKTVNAR